MPLIVVQVVASFDIDTKRSTSSLILELYLSAANDAQFDVIRWALRNETLNHRLFGIFIFFIFHFQIGRKTYLGVE